MARTKGALGKKTLLKLAIQQAGNIKPEFDNVVPLQDQQEDIQSLDINIPQKSTTSKLSGKYINQFTGKSLTDSLAMAIEWSKNNMVELTDFYRQKAFNGKSILVGYNFV